MTVIDAVLDRFRSSSSLAIVCHDDPDPDALSSAIALEELARAYGVDTIEILYDGTISHQQNRAFVSLLDISLRRYSASRLRSHEVTAFVDHSIPGDHNSVDPGTRLDIVLDHHPSERPVPAAIADIRESYGATATILAKYFRDAPVEITSRIASGLLFGIHRERLDFYCQPTGLEYELAGYLHAHADSELLCKLYGSSYLPDNVDTLGDVISNRVQRGSSVASCIGRLEDRVALAQAADFLLLIDGVDTVLVCGIVRNELHLSGRTIRPDLDLGAAFRELFGHLGSVGGHADMAGGQVPVSAVDIKAETEAELVDSIREHVGHRFFEGI
jgi:nanoRNase/pAp phosphatase (c-di-AMP/oligoRNAs hydrolase)